MKQQKKNRSGKKASSLLKLCLLLICLYVGLQYSRGAAGTSQDAGQTAAQAVEEQTGRETLQEEETSSAQDAAAEDPSERNENDAENAAAEGDGFSESTVDANPEQIPDYNGEDVITLNDNVPNFTEYDLENMEGQHFSELDELGRCGVAYAMLDESMMPTGKRGDISMIHPTGWHSVTYSVVTSEDQHLYNRSHLLAYSLTGQNDNERNLITGTQHLNQEVMLPYENQVVWYLEDNGGHVLYRVTPYFAEDELVARGVEMEAYSVEDDGDGVEYHIFIYNVQPGVEIDYQTGESWETEDERQELDDAA